MSKTDDGALIDWTTIGRERFERLIEALIPYQHPHGTLVHPVDGRGGDGGIDALAIEPSEDTEGMVVYRDDPGLVVVYQLKYFPDGFSGRNKDRQQQIRRSLRQAIKNVPRMKKWFLVAPCTASNTGWEFLSKLGKENHGLEISFIHRGILDGPKWVANYPEVAVAIVHRDEMRAAAIDYKLEAAVLDGGVTQLLERQMNLNSVTDKVDPHWTWRVSALPGGVPMLALHAKHPNASAISPVGITFDVDGASTVGAAFAKQQAYGLIDPVRLPGEVVSNFTVNGSEFVVSGLSDGPLQYLEVRPDALLDDPKTLVLSFLNSDGKVLKSVRGRVPSAAVGPKGVTIRHDFCDGCLVVDWRLSKDPSMGADASVSQDLSGPRSPEQVRDTAALVLAFNEMSTNMKLLLPDGTELAHISMGAGGTPHRPSELDDLRKLRESAEDLVAIQHLCDRQFEFPQEASVRDRIDARILRRLLEGRIVCLPDAQFLHVNILPEALNDETFVSFIENPSKLMFERTPFEWTLDLLKDQGDQAVIILDEPLSYYYPELVADNAPEVLGALGRGEVAQLNLRSPSKLPPRLFLKNRLPAETKIVAEPWSLFGVPELPELRG